MDIENKTNVKKIDAIKQDNTEVKKTNEEIQKEAIKEALKLDSEVMKNKVSELTGDKKGEADSNSLLLERNMIRETMKEKGLISEKSAKGLEAAYGFKVHEMSTLGTIKSALGNYINEHEFGGIKTISDEVIELEDRAMEVIGDCESGWVRPGAFKEYFQNEIDNIKMKKIAQEKNMKVKIPENFFKPGFETLKKSINDAKYDQFTRMIMESKPESIEADWKRRMDEQKVSGRVEKDIFDSWINNVSVVQQLDSDVNSFRRQGKNRDVLHAEKNIQRAEILGLLPSNKANQLREKVEK